MATSRPTVLLIMTDEERWELLGLSDIGAHVPDVTEPPSHADGLVGRPDAHRLFRYLWPQLLYPQPADVTCRCPYLWLHRLVDRAIERILDALDRSGMAEETIVAFTADPEERVNRWTSPDAPAPAPGRPPPERPERTTIPWMNVSFRRTAGGRTNG
jgi:arylsulfatase A-like enzyme